MLVNLTPHSIRIYDANGEVQKVIDPSGEVVRVSVQHRILSEVDGVELATTILTDPVAVPEPQEGVTYIVSSLVAQQLTDRPDIVAPDTGPDSAVRDENGQIVGIRRLQKFG